MPPLYRDAAIVLRTHKLGEADRIITMLTRNRGKKRAVAKGVRKTKSKFGARLEPGMVVFIDAGSTNLAIAHLIEPDLPVTVVTNTPLIAVALMEKPGVDLILLGGPLNRAVGAAISARAQRDAELLRPDLCFLGTCGADAVAGLTAIYFEDAEFKRLVAQRSRRLVVAVTSDKLGTAAAHGVVDINDKVTLLLEADASAEHRAAFEAAGHLTPCFRPPPLLTL